MKDWWETQIDFSPVPAARPRVTGKGIAYYPKTHMVYKKKLEDHFKTLEPFQLPEGVGYEVYVEFVLPPYKTSDYPFPRQDLDNLWKLPIDVMTSAGTYWLDDHMIMKTTIEKRFANPREYPFTYIHVKEYVRGT